MMLMAHLLCPSMSACPRLPVLRRHQPYVFHHWFPTGRCGIQARLPALPKVDCQTVSQFHGPGSISTVLGLVLDSKLSGLKAISPRPGSRGQLVLTPIGRETSVTQASLVSC